MGRPSFPILESCEFGVSRIGLVKVQRKWHGQWRGILNKDEELFLYQYQGNELKDKEFGSKNTRSKARGHSRWGYQGCCVRDWMGCGVDTEVSQTLMEEVIWRIGHEWELSLQWVRPSDQRLMSNSSEQKERVLQPLLWKSHRSRDMCRVHRYEWLGSKENNNLIS